MAIRSCRLRAVWFTLMTGLLLLSASADAGRHHTPGDVNGPCLGCHLFNFMHQQHPEKKNSALKCSIPDRTRSGDSLKFWPGMTGTSSRTGKCGTIIKYLETRDFRRIITPPALLEQCLSFTNETAQMSYMERILASELREPHQTQHMMQEGSPATGALA
ncbi:hypothetical protein PoB_007217700 [Plakobranchus ocellatus]|uniref:Uncharacterized protein n=1 Tax=Plakobranchus ocellatus TaxID=259542 RepID=A0AAV4DN09_9GAST|nr:hypothetical protein PoB_007217700 [Plakobranchus ocellatus]